MITKIFFIDTFVNGPFSGGRMAFFLLKKMADSDFMQQMAAQTALPLTAYAAGHNNAFEIRCFNPRHEVDTDDNYGIFAAAHALFEAGVSPADRPLSLFLNGSEVQIEKNQASGRISRDVPIQQASAIDKLTVADKFAIPPEDILMAGQFPGGNLGLCLKSFDRLQAISNNKIIEAATFFPVTLSAPHKDVDGAYVLKHYHLKTDELIQADMNLKAHIFFASFWSAFFNKPAICGFELSPRSAKVYLDMKVNSIAISGEALILFKADPMRAFIT